MAAVDRAPTRRPLSFGLPALFSTVVSKWDERAERIAAGDLSRHELDITVREIKGEREAAANHRLITTVADKEMRFYDEAVAKSGTSAGKHRIAANRLEVLTDLNDATIARYAR